VGHTEEKTQRKEGKRRQRREFAKKLGDL